MGRTIHKSFLNKGGKIEYSNSFISVRLIRSALEKNFRIVPIDESPNIMRYKIVRFLRLYGGPVIWPSASIVLNLSKNKDKDVLSYTFTWPEWLIVVLAAIVFGVIVAYDFNPVGPISTRISEGLFVALMTLMFYGGMVFLDTKYVASKIQKSLINI